MSRLADYQHSYRFVRFERRDGILEIAIHNNGGPATWSAYPGGLHEELGDAFYQVGRDRENRIVILTGTGDRFLTDMDFSEKDPDMGTPAFCDRITKDDKDLHHNQMDTEVTMIDDVNGTAFI